MAEEQRVSLDIKDINQDAEIRNVETRLKEKISGLESDFTMLSVRLEERENAGPKIDWRVVIAAVVGVVGVGGSVGGFISQALIGTALKPIQEDNIKYQSKLAVVERDLAVQKATVKSSSEGALQAAKDLVAQLEQDLARSFDDIDELKLRYETLNTISSDFVNEQRFEEKLVALSDQKSRDIEAARLALSEDITRLTAVEDGIVEKIDAVEAQLSQTLGVAVFEERFNFLSQQRTDDQNVARDQRTGDQAALFRIIGDRITPRIESLEIGLDRIEERIQNLALSLSEASHRSGGGGK